MRKNDAKALLALLGCCCCCDDEGQDEALRLKTKRLQGAWDSDGAQGSMSTYARLPGMPPIKHGGVIDEPFVPAQPPSFDTPQRPGLGHLPEVLKDGVFSGSGGVGWGLGLILDDGREVDIEGDFTVNHHWRLVRWPGSPLSKDVQTVSLPLPHNLITGSQGAVFWKDYRGEEDATVVSGYDVVTQPFDPEKPRDVQRIASTGAISIPLVRLIGDYVAHRGYVGEGGTLYAKYRTVYSDGTYSDESRYAITPEGTYPHIGESQYLADTAQAASAPPPVTRDAAWVSPDQAVQVGIGWRRDHARLTDDQGQPLTLIAYGHALVGGSWAACCGPTLEDGSAPAWIIHEADELVTRVTPEGQADTLGRSVFEVEILRVKPGTFQRFSALGTLFNSWPPQWALCEIETDKTKEVRAVGRHDPWRDSVAARRPPTSLDPDWWYWPTRPKRRPRTLPATAPSAPLNLALADVGVSGKGGGGET